MYILKSRNEYWEKEICQILSKNCFTLQHLNNKDDSVLKAINKLCYCSVGTAQRILTSWATLSLWMKQRSLLSSGQWRRAVHLTLVSVVQTTVATHCSCLAALQQDAEVITHTAHTKKETCTNTACCKGEHSHPNVPSASVCMYRTTCKNTGLHTVLLCRSTVCVCAQDIKNFKSCLLTDLLDSV